MVHRITGQHTPTAQSLSLSTGHSQPHDCRQGVNTSTTIQASEGTPKALLTALLTPGSHSGPQVTPCTLFEPQGTPKAGAQEGWQHPTYAPPHTAALPVCCGPLIGLLCAGQHLVFSLSNGPPQGGPVLQQVPPLKLQAGGYQLTTPQTGASNRQPH